jgi:hypothetical protein
MELRAAYLEFIRALCAERDLDLAFDLHPRYVMRA